MRVAVVRAVVVVTIVASLLSACATGDSAVTTAAVPDKPDTGKWKFARRIDPISGAPATTAWLYISKFDFLAGKNYEGELQLTCFKDQPVVRLIFNLRIGSDKNAAIAYRFDDKPGRDVKARFFARQKTIAIDDKAEIARFVDELATSKTLFLRIASLTVGGFSAKFPVNGAPAAIEAAFAGCPLSPDKSPRRASA